MSTEEIISMSGSKIILLKNAKIFGGFRFSSYFCTVKQKKKFNTLLLTTKIQTIMKANKAQEEYPIHFRDSIDKNGETYTIKYAIFNTTFYLHLTDFYNNPVDACYEMILKLHELNLL